MVDGWMLMRGWMMLLFFCAEQASQYIKLFFALAPATLAGWQACEGRRDNKGLELGSNQYSVISSLGRQSVLVSVSVSVSVSCVCLPSAHARMWVNGTWSLPLGEPYVSSSLKAMDEWMDGFKFFRFFPCLVFSALLSSIADARRWESSCNAMQCSSKKALRQLQKHKGHSIPSNQSILDIPPQHHQQQHPNGNSYMLPKYARTEYVCASSPSAIFPFSILDSRSTIDIFQ